MKLIFTHNPFHPHDKDKDSEYPWIYGRADDSVASGFSTETLQIRQEVAYYLRGKLDSSKEDLKEILEREESAKLT